jgi:hypothetical protein
MSMAQSENGTAAEEKATEKTIAALKAANDPEGRTPEPK